MIAILNKVQQFLDSNNIDGAREEVAKTKLNLSAVDISVINFATLIALGSQKTLEISLGVLGRKLLNNDTEISIDVIWLFLAAVLSRKSIDPNSPSRISILGLISCVKDWKLPIFALLTPALDSFLKVSLSEGNPLIAEQTLDLIATWGENYAEAPHSRSQINMLKFLTQSVLDKVDDLELKLEWDEGCRDFFQEAFKKADNTKQYFDANIWSAGGELLKNIYVPQVLNYDVEGNYKKVKENIFRLITSSLAAIKTVVDGHGLSIAVRIDNLRENNLWSVGASVIDKLERLLQEIADITFASKAKLPTFTPPQSIPGSWTIILQMELTSQQSSSLAKAISSLSPTNNKEYEIELSSSLIENGEDESNKSIVNSWQDFVAELKEENLTVDLAVSTHISDLSFIRAISTEDIPNTEEAVPHQIRLLSRDVPQADRLERILDFASLLIQYPLSLSTVQQKFLEIDGITKRYFSYYRTSSEILGLANKRGQPTTNCYILNRLPMKEAKMRFLAYQFISSNVGSTWFKWQKADDPSQIQPDSATEFLLAVCPSLSLSTVQRRAHTLETWLSVFKQYY